MPKTMHEPGIPTESRQRLAFAIAGITLSLILAACDSEPREPVATLLDAPGFRILSEPRSYPKEGGRTEYAEIHIYAGGRRIDPESISHALFPRQHLCHSPFFTIRNVRILPDNAALVHFSSTNSHCPLGNTHLARLSVSKRKLKVERIVINDDVSTINSVCMARQAEDGIRCHHGGETHALRHAAQASKASLPVIVSTGTLERPDSRVLAIDPETLTQTNLGPGDLLRIEAGAEIVLITHSTRAGPNPVFSVRAVRLSDGRTLDRITYPVGCFRTNSESANGRAALHLHQLEQVEHVRQLHAAVISGRQAPQPIHSGQSDFSSDNLSPLAQSANRFAVDDILRSAAKETRWLNGQLTFPAPSDLRRLPGCG